MSRTAEKQRPMAIQAALGGNEQHLFKGMLAEAGLLMLMSIILALVITKGGFHIMQQYLSLILPRVNELSLNPITFGCAVLITISFALFFAKLSIRMINCHELNTILQSSGKGSGLQVSKKTRQVLIASQVALATVLVFTNFSLLKNAVNSINTPIGFATDNISTLDLNFSSSDYPSHEEAIQIMAKIMEKLEALPQVESIAQGSSPLDGYYVSALNNLANDKNYTPYFKHVDHRYFSMIEQEILQGDNFTITDRRDGANIIIVNQAFAKQLKADGDVLGLQISTGRPEPLKIVGIVKDITIRDDSSALGSSVPRVYGPNGLSVKTFLLKFKPDQSVSREQLGQLLAEVDSRYSVFSFNSASETLTQSLFSEITIAVTTAVLALITLFLAGIGLYGILSYSTQIRRLELGTHMAVGAKRYDLILMIIKDNALPIIVGILFSLVILLTMYLVFSVELTNYITLQLAPMFVVTLLLISMLSLLACYLPLKQYINQPVVHSLKGSK